ncbi:hypothetical protein PRIPAC_92694 [Pristionchus pacificus]|uniref:non-specific serine/threonine protein kinase n=1 Tax=Pristionchus pacificus TaxID=54126 RepID=A0A2A6BAH7_PRIPA|nr:hypothetical protein PRIPAC_92694 [Pristionchus pacificus]|eukprot:PDM62882.1 protein kinase [Pristionchus pacificus]
MAPNWTPEAPKRNSFSRLRKYDIDSDCKRRRMLSPTSSPSAEASTTSSTIVDLSFTSKNFITIKGLGEGDFGVVKEVQSKHSPDRFALKTSKVDKLKVKTGLNYCKTHLDEVRAHSGLLSHPNLLQFHQAWKEDGHIHILLELCDDSLDGFWRKMIELSQKDITAVLKDSLQALQHLSSLNVLHLDIKPGNILRTEEGLYKLADFSVAIDLNKSDSSSGEFGDGRFAAPELLNGIFTSKADLFSLAMSLIQVSVPASSPLSSHEWNTAKNDGVMPIRVSEALAGPHKLNETIESMIGEQSTRPSVDDVLDRISNNSIEAEREQAKFENNSIRNLMTRLSLSPSFERELKVNNTSLFNASQYPSVTFHTDPLFYEMPKPLRQRSSLGARKPPKRPIFD